MVEIVVDRLCLADFFPPCGLTDIPNLAKVCTTSNMGKQHPRKWSLAARPKISNATMYGGVRACAVSTACVLLLDGKVVVNSLPTRIRLVEAMMDGLPERTTHCITVWLIRIEAERLVRKCVLMAERGELGDKEKERGCKTKIKKQRKRKYKTESRVRHEDFPPGHPR